MSIWVLDSSAILAFLRNETGAAAVNFILKAKRDIRVIHAINLCEVYYDFHRTNGPEIAEQTLTDLGNPGIGD